MREGVRRVSKMHHSLGESGPPQSAQELLVRSDHYRVLELGERHKKGIVDDAPAVGRDLGGERHQRQYFAQEEGRLL